MPIGLIYSMCREEKQMFNISLRKPDCAVRKTLMWVMQTPSLCKYNFSSPNYKKNEAFSEWRVLFTFLLIWDCVYSLIFVDTFFVDFYVHICVYLYICVYFLTTELFFTACLFEAVTSCMIAVILMFYLQFIKVVHMHDSCRAFFIKGIWLAEHVVICKY